MNQFIHNIVAYLYSLEFVLFQYNHGVCTKLTQLARVRTILDVLYSGIK